MATGKTIYPLRSIQGEIIKHSGIIFRVKNAHDENGQVIHEGMPNSIRPTPSVNPTNEPKRSNATTSSTASSA